MSLGLDDRLLGEKVHNYCSSSEEEDDDEESGSGDEETMAGTMSRQNLPPPEIGEYEGHCTNVNINRLTCLIRFHDWDGDQ